MMASAQKFLYHLRPSVPTSDEYALKCTGLEYEILELLKDIRSDINFMESQLKDIVYDGRQLCGGPAELHVVLYTLCVYSIQNYDIFKNYFFEIAGWFSYDPEYSLELTCVLRLLEVQYVGDVGLGPGTQSQKLVQAFGSIVGQLYYESAYWARDAKETIDLCTIGFISKWMSPNQPHWVQQGDALKNFLSVAKAELHERVPDHLDHVYRNVSKLVVSNDVPQIVKELYLPILINWWEPIHVSSSTMTTDEEYSEVQQMLFSLDLSHLYDLFKGNCIQDSTLKLVWPELREILELSGVKKGPIYEIKSYISRRKAKMPTEQRSSSTEEKLLGASKSSQN